MSKYATLVNVLDQLRSEAPKEFKSYHALPTELEKLDFARAKAFIHLFLKVRFGLLEFGERERFVTDGSYDGGIDAYYIDVETKTIFVLQSKFRTNAPNFEGKQIELKEVLKMDADRISEGMTEDEDGNKYNGKIQAMLERIKELPDPARYKWQVVLLANLKNAKPSDLKKLTGGFAAVVF
ncbi:MAG: abortive phage infection protein [Limisphaerales bacterium]|nr:MAG: abortive phage infection protein [Limisphaerales bacterium]KAG0509566.1 MAG: abortive phage infection protein [Limisphaerales bacterium]TXT52402.1 MAG: abortive phage infection protein [Limisphaerales bacterium]